MNTRIPVLACVPLLLLGVAPVRASTTGAELNVAGSITPAGACDMKVGSGHIEFGEIDLNPEPTKPTKLDTQRVKMVITCTVPRRYALFAGSSTSTGGNPQDFGLISTADRSPAGSLYVRLDSSSDHIDGARAYHTGAEASLDLADAPWGPSTFSVWPLSAGGHAIGFVTTDGSHATPSPIMNLDTYLLVDPVIKPSNELDRRDEIAFYGDLGFEIRYF